MADETTSEEQEQVKRIIKRFKHYAMRWYMAFACLCLSIIFLLPITHKIVWKLTHVGMIIVCCFTLPLVFTWATNRFARRLSTEEIVLLKQATESDNDPVTNGAAVSLLRTIAPEKMLLRPSQQPQDTMTLLRAATHIDTTPQEQLLRLSNEEE